MTIIPPAGARRGQAIRRTGPVSQSHRKSLNQMERQLEMFHADLWRAQYLNWSGLKSNLDYSRIYDQYNSCFLPETITNLDASNADPKRKKYILSFLVANHLEAVYREANEAIALSETQATVEYEGRTIPYRSIPSLIANEPYTNKRHLLAGLFAGKTAELNPLRMQLYHGLDDHARGVGFNNYIDLCNELFDLRMPELLPLTNLILKQTDIAYREALGEYLARIGISIDQGWAYELNIILRASAHDHFFNKDLLFETMTATLSGLGIDLGRQNNIILDIENRPLKHPRSFCAPIRIPQEISLVLSPNGGWLDYRTGLHELGHAEHFANANSRLPFAYKFCGDLSVSEAFAFLFDNMMSNRHWVERYIGMPDQSEYAKFNNFFRLYLLRYMVAKLLFEKELYNSSDIGQMGERYANIYSSCLLLHFDGRNYLQKLDKGFYCLLYLRGMALEVQLRKYLSNNYGEEWFADSKAGNLLTDLWKECLKYDAEEVARLLGYKGIDYGLLIQDVSTPRL